MTEEKQGSTVKDCTEGRGRHADAEDIRSEAGRRPRADAAPDDTGDDDPDFDDTADDDEEVTL